jgi:hypothetical protein
MGWLFALALGFQEKNRRAILLALIPIALGHALSVGAVVAMLVLAQTTVPQNIVRWTAVAVLLGFGIFRLVSARHPRWVGMRVGFGDLTLWSFLMASAHGAGLMLAPLFLAAPLLPRDNAFLAISQTASGTICSAGASSPLASAGTATAAVLVHTFAHLIVAALVALLVYDKLGLKVLQKSWFNLDLLWAFALIVSAVVLILV